MLAIAVATYIGYGNFEWLYTAQSAGGAGLVAGNAGANAFIGGFFAGAINTGSLQGAIMGSLTAGAFNAAGTLFPVGSHFTENVMAHAVVGCASAVIGDGSCRAGAYAGGFSAWATPGISGSLPAQVTQAAVIGGVGSVLGGGKFGNGAVTGAFGYLFNYCAHNKCFTSSDERAFLNRGDYLGYYAKACEGGDPYACQAGEIAKGQSPIAQATTARLQMYAVDNLGREFTAAEMNDIRLKLATSYADYLGPSLASGKWPTALDISVIHWQVFGSYGLPPSAFGGTPFGMVPAMIFGPSFYKEYPPPYSGPGWCPKCAKGSLF